MPEIEKTTSDKFPGLDKLHSDDLINLRSKIDEILNRRNKDEMRAVMADIRRQARTLGLKVQFSKLKSHRPLRKSPATQKKESGSL